jgi:hypothetical protein
MRIGNIEASYKDGSIIAGLIAFGLIVSGSTNILINPILSVIQILYAFFIMLPLSYYQMKQIEPET